MSCLPFLLSLLKGEEIQTCVFFVFVWLVCACVCVCVRTHAHWSVLLREWGWIELEMTLKAGPVINHGQCLKKYF